jgi:hypothetical protein
MATKSTTLTPAQCWAVNSFLFSAALKFEELAKTAAQIPGGSMMVEAFTTQAAEAKELANMFATADSAVLIEEVE